MLYCLHSPFLPKKRQKAYLPKNTILFCRKKLKFFKKKSCILVRNLLEYNTGGAKWIKVVDGGCEIHLKIRKGDDNDADWRI